MDQNGVGKPPIDGVSQSDQDNLLAFLMEKLKMTSKQVKAWSEERLKIRDAMAVYKNTDNVDPERLQKCLENIKRAITVSSLPAMVERLEALAKPVNLKVTSTPEGNIFISSDTFYVEVVMGENGNVKDVMVAQSKDPVSCPEMCEALRENNFKEFGEHLKGLTEFYQGGGDGNQKTKAFTSLQCLEKDLLTLLGLSKKPGSTPLILVKNSLGYCTPRAGGRHMRLTYFVSPYDLLDVEQKQAKELGPDDPLPKDIGLWVSLGVESSPPRKLQTMPLIVTATTDGKLTHVNTAIGPTNSILLPAVFTLTLSQPMPVSVMLLKQLQNRYGVTMTYSEPPTALPINTLICRHMLDPDFATNPQQRTLPHPRGYTFHVKLPDQKHRYFVTDSLMVGDVRGVLITKILFVQHTQVIQTLQCLRQQATYNALVSSCVRKTSDGDEDDDEEEVFEVTAYHHCRMTVLFEHPAKDGMACVEFDTTEPSNPKCKLYQREGEEPFCSDEYATKVLQKCLSIPITMRAILKKTVGWLEMRKQKEAPAAATPAVGPPTYPSQNLPSSGPFSTLQKFSNSFGGSTGPSFNTGRIKERSMSNVSNVPGSILSDLSSTFANFFPQSSAQPSYSGTVTPSQTTVTTPSDPAAIACKQTQNPMLASLLQSTTVGGGPPANRLPVQQVPKDPIRTHHPPPLPPPPTTTAAQQQKHTKNPMLLNLLQEPNIDAKLATSLHVKTVKKRKRKPNEKSPKQFPEEEPGSASQVGSGSQDVFVFPGNTKLSSIPFLSENAKSLQRQSSTSSEPMKSPFDPTKSNTVLNDLSALLHKPVDQNKPQKKRQGRSDSVSSASSAGAAAPSPRQSPKTPMSPAATTPRPSRSISSTPELSAPSPSNVLPGMITEMLPKSDPLPAMDPAHALSPDFPMPQKALTTPSHQLTIDPFDFTEDIIQKNIPNFDMFVNSKTDPDDFGLPNVSSAIAKLESASDLETEDDKTPTLDVSSLLSLTPGPSKPTLVGSRSQSFDLQSPGTPSLRSFGEDALDLTKAESLKSQSGNTTPSGKELRSSISSPVAPAQGSMPSPTVTKKAVSKAHTSKGKPKNFTLEGAGPYQTDVTKKNRKRYKKTVKEPGGQGETGSKKNRKKGRRPKYPDSSPECPTGEGYETSVRSEQPLKMTIKLKPISETKPKVKIAAPTPKIKVKLPALDPSSTHSGSTKEDNSETNLKGPTAITTTKPVHQRRGSDEAKKDKGEVKQGEKLPKRESIEGSRADVTDRGIVRRLSESQKMIAEKKSEDRPTLKSQSSLSRLKTPSPKLTKIREGVKRSPHGVGPKGDLQKKSREEILNTVLNRSSVADYKIPKLNKSGGQKTPAKTGPEGDSGNSSTDAAKKSGQSPSLTKSADQTKLSSPLRNSNPSVQRPRSASPSMRLDPAKRSDASKSSFTKPTPSQKVGSVSPRGSVSPQSSFSTKSRTSTERSSRGDTPSPLGSGASPSHKLSSASQLKTPPVSTSSPSHPKSGLSSTGQVKSTQASSSPVHSSKPLSTSSPSQTSKGSGSSITTSHTKTASNVSTTSTNKTGSSPSHHSKAITMVVSSANHPMKSPSVTSPSGPKPSTPVSQAKTIQSSKPPILATAGPGKSAPRPAPLVITTSTRPVTPKSATPTATTPRTPVATTPTSAGPRLRSPPAKSSRKIASLNAIVSKLTERVQEKEKPAERLPGEESVTLGEKGKDVEEPKKLELDQGDNEKVVSVLINSGLVEKSPVVTAKNLATKASPSNKPAGKDDSAKAALAARQATDAKPGLPNPKSAPVSQTKSAVAQALKNISQAAKVTSTPSSKPSPSPSTTSKTSTPAKSPANVKAAPSKMNTAKVVTSPSDKGSGNVSTKSGAVTSSSKTATQSKVSSPSVKTSVGTVPPKTSSGGPPRPKLIIPSQSRGSSQSTSPVKTPTKTSQSPSSHRPIILSRSSSTVTSPDKGATKVTRVQIAPLSSPGVTGSTPSGGKQSVKGQSPSVSAKTKPEKNDSKKEPDSKKGTQPPSMESKDIPSGATKIPSEKTYAVGEKGGKDGLSESLTAEKATGVPNKIGESKETGFPKSGDKNKNKADQRKDDMKQTPAKAEVKPSMAEAAASTTASVSKIGTVSKSEKKEEAGSKSDKKEEKKSLKVNLDSSSVPKQSLKRTASREGGGEVPTKAMRTSLSAESNLVQTPDSTPKIIPLPTKSVNKPITKTQTIKSVVQPAKAGNLVARSPLASSVPSIPSIPSIPKDMDFKVPSPAMIPPSSPRTIIHGVRSPGPSFKPSSPTKATSPVSPGGVPSPVAGIPATGGVPSPQGVKRAATPVECALPSKRSMLLESCSPVSPAESDDGLVIDVPASPSQRRQKMFAEKASSKESGDVPNKGMMHVKSPLPRSPLAKSPSMVTKSPAGISVGSGDAGSPCTLDDDLMNEALSSIREIREDLA